jgi:hypothetical protein
VHRSQTSARLVYPPLTARRFDKTLLSALLRLRALLRLYVEPY